MFFLFSIFMIHHLFFSSSQRPHSYDLMSHLDKKRTKMELLRSILLLSWLTMFQSFIVGSESKVIQEPLQNSVNIKTSETSEEVSA